MKDTNKRLTQVSATDTKYLVYAKATYFPDFVRVWIPNVPTISQVEGYERKLKASSQKTAGEDYETNEERSLRLTRKTIKNYALCNDFDIFATFTIGGKDRADNNLSKRRISTWFKNQRMRNGKFRYLMVTEPHKNGVFHFHALIGGYSGRLVLAVNINTGKNIPDKRGGYVYNFDEFKLGFSSAKFISNKDGKTKTAYYLQKYINKDMVIVFGKNRYQVSHGLKKPKTEHNPEPFYKQYEADRHWVIDHGTVLEFDRGKYPLIDSFIEANQ